MFSCHSNRSDQLETLAIKVNAADSATSELLFRVIAETSLRMSNQAGTARLHRLIESGAFTEAAFALVELELPQWKLRRIAYDEGEWHCALSRQRELPDWLDRAIEAHHADLTLAVLGTYLEAAKQIEASRMPGRPSVPQTGSGRFEPLSCENYA
jgi:hypothetical protein